ncbi:hypothetical protein D5R93_07605 [Actinomyces lilanjuaniae]|uniref:Secreted protein n=1 Tax=Actinomyces lilanjuaniae TaxID=2321394 RepID=A0ABN5PNP9_9ACTO|nr:hypothetical protein D5R93_07605 [Actinomyces lilanjuaniae]
MPSWSGPAVEGGGISTGPVASVEADSPAAAVPSLLLMVLASARAAATTAITTTSAVAAIKPGRVNGLRPCAPVLSDVVMTLS